MHWVDLVRPWFTSHKKSKRQSAKREWGNWACCVPLLTQSLMAVTDHTDVRVCAALGFRGLLFVHNFGLVSFLTRHWRSSQILIIFRNLSSNVKLGLLV